MHDVKKVRYNSASEAVRTSPGGSSIRSSHGQVRLSIDALCKQTKINHKTEEKHQRPRDSGKLFQSFLCDGDVHAQVRSEGCE